MSGYEENAKALREFCSPEMDDDLLCKMQSNLAGCLDCVMAYHYARQYFLKRNESSRKASKAIHVVHYWDRKY